MLFTWDTTNLCIVFRWWHIRSTPSLILSLLAVVALGAGYEALREGIRRYEVVLAKRADAVPRKFTSPFSFISFAPSISFSLMSVSCQTPICCESKQLSRIFAAPPFKEDDRETRGDRDDNDTETTPFLRTGQAQADVNKRAHLIKAVLYGIQNFYAFMIM